MTIHMETPNNIRDAMGLAGVSQYTLANHLNISQASVSRRLAGVLDFSVTQLRSTAALLNVPVESLINAAALAEDGVPEIPGIRDGRL